MSRCRKSFFSAYKLWRWSVSHRLFQTDPVVSRSVEVPIGARPVAIHASSVFTTPPGLHGWVVVPRPAELPAAANLLTMLHRAGIGTLEIIFESDGTVFDVRVEQLIAAASWLDGQNVTRQKLPIGLVGLGAAAAPTLAAAASGVRPLAAVVAVAGRYDQLDKMHLAGLRTPVQLIAARYDAEGLRQARHVSTWLGADATHEVVMVPGDATGITPIGWRHARWLAFGWLLDHLMVEDTADSARSRHAGRVRMVQSGFLLLPMGALMASAWMATPLPFGMAPSLHAAPARLWASLDLAHHTGGSMVPFRMEAVLPGAIDLSAMDGTIGLRINGISTGDRSGQSVSNAGDVNGDGFDDVIIGAFQADPNGNISGQSYVIYGGTAVPSTVEISALNGTTGFSINGNPGYQTGRSVSAAGDVNNDGFDDVLIGTNAAAPNGAFSGQSYVVYGGSALPSMIDLSALNGTNGFTANGISLNDNSGLRVSGAGDVNADGFDDILIGGIYADPHGSKSGQSYLVYGGSALPATVELSSLNGTNGFTANGISTGDYSGSSVSDAGDVNADGFGDILIGAFGAAPHGSYTGQSYVVYGGSSLPSTVELSSLNGTTGFRLNGISSFDNAAVVSGAGDVNGDGVDDILIGAFFADPNGLNSGQSYVVYGGTNLPSTFELSSLNGTTGFRINGISFADYSGGPVSDAGDVNGDGLNDILIGAWHASPHGGASGQSYVVYGATGVPSTVELSALNGTTGFRVNGISADDRSGWSVSGAGDVNADGFSDILIGAWRADPNGSDSGQSYIVYGNGDVPSSPTPPATSTPTHTPTATSSSTATRTSTVTATGTPTSTRTATPSSTATPSNTSSATPTNSPTASSTSTATATPTNLPTNTPTPTPSRTATPTVTPTPTHPRGDCNADNAVNAADVSGIVLEIFDGDGTSPAAVPGGTFPGDPIGCNANADTLVDAGDLACVVRLIFGSGGGCAP